MENNVSAQESSTNIPDIRKQLSDEQLRRVDFIKEISRNIAECGGLRKYFSVVSAKSLEYLYQKKYSVDLRGLTRHDGAYPFLEKNFFGKSQYVLQLFVKRVRDILTKKIIRSLYVMHSEDGKSAGIVRTVIQEQVIKTVLKREKELQDSGRVNKTYFTSYNRWIILAEYLLDLLKLVLRFRKIGYNHLTAQISDPRGLLWLNVLDFISVRPKYLLLSTLSRELSKNKHIEQLVFAEMSYYCDAITTGCTRRLVLTFVQHGLIDLGSVWTPEFSKAFVLNDVDNFFITQTHPSEVAVEKLRENSKPHTVSKPVTALIALIYPTNKWPVERLKKSFYEIITDLLQKNVTIFIKDHPRSKSVWWMSELLKDESVTILGKEQSFVDFMERESPDIVFSFASTTLVEAVQYGSIAVNISSGYDDDLLLPKNDRILEYKSDSYNRLMQELL